MTQFNWNQVNGENMQSMMRRLGLGLRKVSVYGGETCLGEVDMVPIGGDSFQFPNNVIRLHGYSAVSERCHPLAVLQTISAPVRCKLEPTLIPTTNHSQLIKLHADCFHERKTAVVIFNNEELHLVAMPSKLNKFPCFWCYSVPVGLYNSCLEMLNRRCLAIVFDLDETLVVASTMKSFEDRIEALRGRIARESDPIRSSGMTAEMNRYIEDRSLLKQYRENDSVVDNDNKLYKANLEKYERGFRPVIRLEEKNVILTRINPDNRDTSVLVRLRPAWEDLKSYLTENGRKRFEVFVCTMAQKEYALEMWRLLDPDSRLISLDQRMNRVVSVKHSSKKSLLNVFQQEKNCHPKMAMVIDDRVDVWDDRDKPRVHVVPAFTPYSAPLAEMAHAAPVLSVVRSVAGNVRGRFFKEFDDILLHKITEIRHEDEVASSPIAALDVSNYLMLKDTRSVPNGTNRQLLPVEVVSNIFKNILVGSQYSPVNVNEYQPEHIPAVAVHCLHKIGQKCNKKVEFKRVIACTSDDLEFSLEIWFGGEKVAIGTGKTMEEAQLLAADKAIRALAEKLISHDNQKQTLNKIWTHIGFIADPLIGC